MTRLVLSLSALLFLVGSYAVLSFPSHHDTAWLLYAARRVLAGATLYVDVVEVNPPLIVFFNLVTVLVADVLEIWDMAVYRIIALGFVGASLLVCRPLLYALAGPDRTAVPAALLLLLTFLFVAFPGLEFGQREHLALVLSTPYLLAAAARALDRAPPSLAAPAIGGLAGLGIALKPFFLPIWLLVELYLVGRIGPRALLRSEHLVIMGVFFLYAALTFVLAPGYIALIPLLAEGYQGYSGMGLAALLRSTESVLFGAVLIAAFLVPGSRRLRPLRIVLSLSLVTFFAAVVVQKRGWDYHWLPVRATGALLLAVTILDARSVWQRLRSWLRTVVQRLPNALRAGVAGATGRSERRPAAGLVVLAATLAILAGWQVNAARGAWHTMTGTGYRLPEFTSLVERYAKGESIAVLSTSLAVAFPLVNYADAEWALRFNSLWVLPGLYGGRHKADGRPFHAPERMGRAERYMFDAVVTDLVRNRPRLLIVDRVPPLFAAGFDFFGYFMQDPRFIELMDDYRLIVVEPEHGALVRVIE